MSSGLRFMHWRDVQKKTWSKQKKTVQFLGASCHSSTSFPLERCPHCTTMWSPGWSCCSAAQTRSWRGFQQQILLTTDTEKSLEMKSLGSLLGTFTGNHGFYQFYHKIWVFPANCPIIQHLDENSSWTGSYECPKGWEVAFFSWRWNKKNTEVRPKKKANSPMLDGLCQRLRIPESECWSIT